MDIQWLEMIKQCIVMSADSIWIFLFFASHIALFFIQSQVHAVHLHLCSPRVVREKKLPDESQSQRVPAERNAKKWWFMHGRFSVGVDRCVLFMTQCKYYDKVMTTWFQMSTRMKYRYMNF